LLAYLGSNSNYGETLVEVHKVRSALASAGIGSELLDALETVALKINEDSREFAEATGTENITHGKNLERYKDLVDVLNSELYRTKVSESPRVAAVQAIREM
jgi:hypothetical protein